MVVGGGEEEQHDDKARHAAVERRVRHSLAVLRTQENHGVDAQNEMAVMMPVYARLERAEHASGMTGNTDAAKV